MRTILVVLGMCGLGLAWSSPAGRADIIRLKSGRLEGKIISRANGRVKIRVANGGFITTVDEDEIVAVEKRKTVRDIYEDMAKELGPKDAEGHYALAVWCRRHNLRDEMMAELVAALKINPDHAGARKDLGYVRTDGGWARREEAMRAKGMVLVDGRWVTKAAAETLERQEKNRRLVRAINTAVSRIRSAPSAKAKQWEEKLANFDDRSLAWKVLSLLDHRLEAVRRAACSSLARMRHHDAIPRLLLRMLTDSKQSVRDAALAALRQLDHERACDVLYETIVGVKLRPIKGRSDQKWAKRTYRRIAVALGVLGDVRSVPLLIETLYPRVEIGGRSAITTGTGGTRTVTQTARGGPTAVDVVQGTTFFGGGTAQPVPRGDKYYFNAAAEEALKSLTGKDLGVLPRDWRKWWKQHGAEVLRKHEAQQRQGRRKADKLLDEAGGERD